MTDLKSEKALISYRPRGIENTHDWRFLFLSIYELSLWMNMIIKTG